MASSALLNRAQLLWVTLAGAVTSFPTGGVRVTVAARVAVVSAGVSGHRGVG